MTAPLSDKLRPTSIDDMVGQLQLLGKGKLLRNIIDSGTLPNMIFYGPSGVGKTTLAKILANKTNKKLFKLNATTASTADIKDIISQIDTFTAPNGILLYLDEIQYFNKKQRNIFYKNFCKNIFILHLMLFSLHCSLITFYNIII